jgi:16S rRNA G527 N7-methylase RsmG
LTSSIEDYKIENGRRYHAYKDGVYILPNDDNELDRLDLTHQMFRLVLNDRLHLAPIENAPIKILDIGTGTGIWAIELGNAWPHAVHGRHWSMRRSNG